MNKSTASFAAYVALLILLAILMPWRAVSAPEFASRSMVAVAVAVIGSVVTRYGLELVLRRAAGDVSRNSGQGYVRLGSVTIGLWPVVKYTLGISLAIDIISTLASTDHTVTPAVAFLAATILQQLTALVAELLIIVKLEESQKRASRVVALIAVMAVATIFARAANIVFVAQKPPVPPLLSDSTNLLFAIPALLMGVVGILSGPLVKRK